MANGWQDLIDDSLIEGFDAPVYDPKKGRAAFVKSLETAKSQFASNTTRAPNRIWKTGNNEGVRLSPKLSGQPVALPGKKDIVVHKSRFSDFLDKLIVAANAGEFDEAIKAALDAKGNGSSTSTKSAGKSSGGEKTFEQIVTGAQRSRTRLANDGGLSDAQIRERWEASSAYPKDVIDHVLSQPKGPGKKGK